VKIEHYPRDFEPALGAAPPAPWIYTGGLENYPRLVGRLAALRPLWGNAGKGLCEVRQSIRLAEAASDAGWHVPRTQRSLPANEDPAGWLVKRRWSSGGLGVRFATDGDRESLDRRGYFQEFIEGQAASAVFVAARGRAILVGASQQLLGRDVGMDDRPFLYAGSIGPLVLSEDETARLQSQGCLLAERFALSGLFGVDFIRTGDGLWLIEVNPRYTASVEVLERATGVSFLGCHAAACQNENFRRSQ
jgi:predicted ATP-grasp superfamily ATP-dependent carboligase